MAPKLPDDLIFDIISRMPPKDAMQLCCMSKNWCWKLTSPTFRALHFTNFTQKGAHSRLSRCCYKKFDNFCITSEGHHNQGSGFSGRCSKEYETVGVINGVVCLSHHISSYVRRIWIWNPITKTMLGLPSLRNLIPHDIVTTDVNDYYQSLGFLYDEPRNEYKIFCLSNECDHKKEPINCNVLVAAISLEGRQWTFFRLPFRVAVANRSPAAFFKGSGHWAVYRQSECDTEGNGYVLCVRGSDCSSTVFALPDAISMNVIRRAVMAVIEGCLALIPWLPFPPVVEDGFFNVWIMEDYGDSISWNIRYRILGEAATWRNKVTLLRSGELLNATMIHRNQNGEPVRVWLCSRINVHPFAQSLEFLEASPCFCASCVTFQLMR